TLAIRSQIGQLHVRDQRRRRGPAKSPASTTLQSITKMRLRPEDIVTLLTTAHARKNARVYV
ncbi:hypothetical protein E4U54_002499, partial [Claviceps lovelessii]